MYGVIFNSRLAQEDELKALRAEMDEIKKSRDDIRLRLRKKEWEYESRVMERDQQRSNVEKLKIKMNRKAAELNEAWNREQELRERSTKLQVQVIMIDVIVEGFMIVIDVLLGILYSRRVGHGLYNIWPC